MKSIRTKILTVVISGLLILSFTIGGVALYATQSMLHRDARTIMNEEIESEATKLNAMLRNMKMSIQIVSEAAVEQLDSAESLLKLEYQQKYTQAMEVLFHNAARNTKGMIAYYFRYNPDLNLPDVGFYYGLTTQDRDLQKLPVTDLSGDRTEILWWNEPVKAGRAVWISPHYHSNSDALMVSYVAPIYKDGILIGVTGMDVQFSSFLDVVKELAPYENGYASLISEAGEELYHPYHDAGMKQADEEIIMASARLDNGMTLQLCAFYNDIQAQGNRMILALLTVSVCVLAVFVIVTVLVTKRIVDPLLRLAHAAKSMEYDTEWITREADRRDEVGVLCRVLNESNRQLQEYMDAVQAQAYRDSMTGLKNGTAYMEDVAKLEKRMAEERVAFGVLLLDINNLKIVNDTYGHDHGNRLIVRVSKIIAGVFRRSIVYRIGGDEFAVILEKEDYDEYEALIEEFKTMCAAEILEIEGESIALSVAHGMAAYDEEMDSSYENVFHRADSLMYRKKREMKNS